jgi:Leucine-rich repeat (LRR) protein
MDRLYYIIYEDRAIYSGKPSQDINLEKLENYDIAEHYILKVYKYLNDRNIFSAPPFIQPILITNDARLFLKYRNAYQHSEFHQFCMDRGNKLPAFKHYENILKGTYNSAQMYVRYANWTDEENGRTYRYEDEEGWMTSLNMNENSTLKKEINFYELEDNKVEDYIQPTDYHFHWWSNLNSYWRNLFSCDVTNVIIGGIPTNEALSEILSLEEINVEYKYRDNYSGQIKSLDPLKVLTNLKVLNASRNNIEDITPLQNLKKIKILNCSDNLIKSLLPIHDLQSLEELDASGNKIEQIETFLGLQNLKKLILSSNQIKELSSISKMTNLEHLKIDHNKIKDISALINLKNLKYLDISNTSLTNLEPLLNLKNLKYLNISNNSLYEPNLEPLIKLTNLETLIFDNNKIQDLELLRRLSNIEHLSFENNEISDLEPISDFKKLKKVNCKGNKITYAEALGYSSRQNFTLHYF